MYWIETLCRSCWQRCSFVNFL